MKALDNIVEVFLQADSKDKIENLLKGILTPSEIQEFATRIKIVKLLKKGVGQHEIARRLNIGVATVTRGSKEIKMGNFKTI